MSIVSSSEVTAWTGASSYDANLTILHLGIEDMIKMQCGKEFESTTYFELYDGKGGYYRLEPKHQPITAVTRVSNAYDTVIKIKNSNTDATTASVKVDSTNVTLVVNGGAGNSSSTLAIATYSTLTLLVNAINALSSAYGWTAELYDSDYSAKKTALLPAQQIDVTSFTNTGDYEYLYMGEPIDFKIVDNQYIEAYFPDGSQNIAISYTAGSSSASIKLAILTIIKMIYDKKTAGADGIKRFTVGDITTEYFTAISEIAGIGDILAMNTRMVV